MLRRVMDDTTRVLPRATLELPTRQQVTILAVASAAVLAVLFGIPALGALFAPKPAPPPPAPPAGTFRVTQDQLQALTIEPVRAMGFSPGVETEGKIATDDDLTTQVYSPFSGRVTQ